MSGIVLRGLVKGSGAAGWRYRKRPQALQKMVLDLESLDATILQFDPSYRMESIKAKAFGPWKDRSDRGQMSRIVPSILRQAAEPLTSRDIALELLVERALDKNDQRLLRIMSKRVGVPLRTQLENGLVQCEQGPGQYMLWMIAK